MQAPDALPPKGQNSQAKGPFSDSTLESVRRQTAMHSTTDEAIRHRRRIFQVKRQSEAFVLI